MTHTQDARTHHAHTDNAPATFLRGYKTELAPNNEQRALFRRYAGASRFVWNWGLATWKYWYGEGKPCSGMRLCKHFNAIKDEQCPWIREVAYSVTEATFRNLDSAFQHFFRRVKAGVAPDEVGYPKFKSRYSRRQSFSLKDTKIEQDRVRLSRIGWVRLKERNYLPTTDSGVKLTTYAAISRTAGRWFISVQAYTAALPAWTDTLAVGLDFGLKHLAVLSNGDVIDNPHALLEAERRLKRLQRELSRRTRGGANWRKTKARLARQYAKVTNIRRHALHDLSHHITYDLRPQAIVLEDLNVKGMMSNHHLAKAIADVGFYELRRQIEYKAQWLGIEVIIADRWYPSSKTCSQCGWKDPDLSLADRVFCCPECGLEIDRDLNAALNLRALAVDIGEP